MLKYVLFVTLGLFIGYPAYGQEVTQSMTVDTYPCDVDQVSTPDIDRNIWYKYDHKLYQTCIRDDITSNTDGTTVIIPTYIATLSTSRETSGDTSVVMYRVDGGEKGQPVEASTFALGVGAPVIYGGNDMGASQYWVVPPYKTGYLLMFTTNHGDSWTLKWSIK